MLNSTWQRLKKRSDFLSIFLKSYHQPYRKKNIRILLWRTVKPQRKRSHTALGRLVMHITPHKRLLRGVSWGERNVSRGQALPWPHNPRALGKPTQPGFNPSPFHVQTGIYLPSRGWPGAASPRHFHKPRKQHWRKQLHSLESLPGLSW